MTASQVARRRAGLRSLFCRPSHRPSAIMPCAINWWAVVWTPLTGMIGCQAINAIHNSAGGTTQNRLRQALPGAAISAGVAAVSVIDGPPCGSRSDIEGLEHGSQNAEPALHQTASQIG